MNQPIEKIPLFQKYTWLKWLIIVPLVGLVFYFLLQLVPNDFEKSSVFTQYGELEGTVLAMSPDTTNQSIDTFLIRTNSLGLRDSIEQILKIDSTNQEKEFTDSLQQKQVVIDESYKFGAAKKNNQNGSADSITGNQLAYHPIDLKATIFDELLLSNNSIDTLKSAYKTFFSNQVVTSKTILKIIATVGKDVLLNGNTEDAKDIFESIVEEDKIIGILLADRKGKIIYTSNAKFLHGNIDAIFPNLKTESHAIGWGNTKNQLVTSLAIYHTYGRIGNVILITQQN